jgi:hypothetical protein
VFNSSLVLGDVPVEMERQALSLSFDYRLSDATTLSIGGGAGTTGFIATKGGRHDILPGWMVTASYARRLVDGYGAEPFVLFGISGGVSGGATRPFGSLSPESTPLYSFDVRAALTVGKTILGVVSPYATAKLFGGPVFWKLAGMPLVGGDRYHYQVGAGLVVALPRGMDLFAEAVPFGERALTAGGGVSF